MPAQTDHVDDRQVEALFERVRADEGGLDLLVANAWGGYEGHDYRTFGAPFWEQPLSRWDAMFGAGLLAQFTAARLAAPLLIDRGRGLIVCTAGNDDFAYYLGNVPLGRRRPRDRAVRASERVPPLGDVIREREMRSSSP